MALLDMERRKGTELMVCHVNYHHRPTADRDEKIVLDYCGQHGIPVAVLRPVHEKGNFQAWAREVRYAFFLEQARRQGIGTVLTAHHRDDLLETYVFQKERGMLCDWYGLRYRTDRQGLTVERPLLGFTKRELEDYCLQHGIPYGLDESNFTDDYERNRIRHRLQDRDRPGLLEEISSRNREILRYSKRAARFFAAHEPVQLLSEPDGPRLLETWISSHTGRHLSAGQTRELFDQLQKGCVTEADSWLIERHKDTLVMAEKDRLEPQTRQIESPEQLAAADLVQEGPGDPVQRLSLTEQDFPLTIRPARDGDAMEMRFGRKKVSRFFIDRQLPRLERMRWFVVENAAGEVIYVPGWGCDRNHFQGGRTFFLRRFSPLAVHDKIKNVTFKEKQL